MSSDLLGLVAAGVNPPGGSSGDPLGERFAAPPRLAQLIESRAEVAIELAGVLAAGDTALAHERWTFRGEGVEGGSSQAPRPTLVLRRLGAEWKLAIAAPWGWAPAPPLEAVL